MHIICKRLKPYEFHFNELVKPSNQYFYRFYCVITSCCNQFDEVFPWIRSQNVSFHFTNQCYKSRRFSELFDKFFPWNQLGTKMCCFIAQILQWYYIRKFFCNQFDKLSCEINLHPKHALWFHEFLPWYYLLWKDVASTNLTNFPVKSIGNQNYVVIDITNFIAILVCKTSCSNIISDFFLP